MASAVNARSTIRDWHGTSWDCCKTTKIRSSSIPVGVLLFWESVFNTTNLATHTLLQFPLLIRSLQVSFRNVVHFGAHLGAVGQLKVVLHLETAKLWFSRVKFSGLRTLVDHPNRALFEGIDHIALGQMASS